MDKPRAASMDVTEVELMDDLSVAALAALTAWQTVLLQAVK